MTTINVADGDTLAKIAKKQGVPDSKINEYVNSLYTLNQKVIGDNKNLIKPNQVLVLPDNSVFANGAKGAKDSKDANADSAFDPNDPLVKSVMAEGPNGEALPTISMDEDPADIVNSIMEDPAKPEASKTPAKAPAPKPTIGQKFKSWVTGSTAKAVQTCKKAGGTTPEQDKMAFAFTDQGFSDAMSTGKDQKAADLYLKGLDKLAKSSNKAMGTGKNGSVSKDKFVAADMEYAKKSGLPVDRAASERGFDVFDTDGDGELSLEESKVRLALLDCDSKTGKTDGQISLKDYLALRNQANKEKNGESVKKKLVAMNNQLNGKETKPEQAQEETLFAAQLAKDTETILKYYPHTQKKYYIKNEVG